jgi:hypothetical protein
MTNTKNGGSLADKTAPIKGFTGPYHGNKVPLSVSTSTASTKENCADKPIPGRHLHECRADFRVATKNNKPPRPDRPQPPLTAMTVQDLPCPSNPRVTLSAPRTLRPDISASTRTNLHQPPLPALTIQDLPCLRNPRVTLSAPRTLRPDIFAPTCTNPSPHPRNHANEPLCDHADRKIFDLPLGDRLQQPTRALRAWVTSQRGALEPRQTTDPHQSPSSNSMSSPEGDHNHPS